MPLLSLPAEIIQKILLEHLHTVYQKNLAATGQIVAHNPQERVDFWKLPAEQRLAYHKKLLSKQCQIHGDSPRLLKTVAFTRMLNLHRPLESLENVAQLREHLSMVLHPFARIMYEGHTNVVSAYMVSSTDWDIARGSYRSFVNAQGLMPGFNRRRILLVEAGESYCECMQVMQIHDMLARYLRNWTSSRYGGEEVVRGWKYCDMPSHIRRVGPSRPLISERGM